MNRRAWIYIWTTFAVAAAMGLQAGLSWHYPPSNWLTIEALFGLAVAAQLFKVEAPNHVLFYSTPIFFFAGAILLDPFLLFLLIVVAHLAEWIKERWSGSEYLSAWYLQPFNIAMFWVAGRSAQLVYMFLHDHTVLGTGGSLAATMVAAALWVILNHAMLGIALVLGRGVPWSESGILDERTFVGDFVLLCVGCTVAILWMVKPWYVLPALAPIGLMYQALMIPRLKREAETDSKTGLYNARHFGELFAAELERARRFDRPLAVIMADLDHLREINNVHGHLAGDAVLVGVAKIIHATVRDYDIAARFGGEEFALLLPEVDEEQARILAERMRSTIETSTFAVSTSSEPLRASMSLGIACYPHDGRTTTELLHAADTAVYGAKSAGRNRVICASEVPSIEPAPEAPAKTSVGALPPVLQPPPGAFSGEAALSFAGDSEFLDATAADAEAESGGSSDARVPVGWLQAGFVTVVTLGGMIAVLAAILATTGASPIAVGLFAVLGGLAELLEVDLSGQGTVSVSVGVVFTAAMLTGIEGLAAVSGVIAIVHHVRQRRGLNQLHRALFNWSVHILGGLVVLALTYHHLPLEVKYLIWLAPTAVAAAVGYFAVETGLIALAIALARGDRESALGWKSAVFAGWRMWRSNFFWLLPHYLVLCIMGLALSVTFTELGALGVVIFALPLLMMHYVQRQYVVHSRENVRALQRLNRDLLRAALHDHVTGLGNERGFQEALRREVHEVSERRQPLTLARVNIDDFRTINEERGRRHGDSMLVEVAEMLAAAPALHRAFRLAADDFAVIMSGVPQTEAILLLDRLRTAASEHLAGATVSIGAASIEIGDFDADQLNQQACEALSEAKRRGRNVVISFEEIRDSTLVASWAQAQGVRKLLAEAQIDVVFQPIWDIDSGNILGYEALARPAVDYGLVGPQEAFDVATRIGRARELDTVCRAAILARAGELPSSTLLFMNVAPESLERNGLPGPELAEAVREAGLRPDQIVLELTERSVIHPDMVVRQAQLLREYGFRFALDDTGAGNAGLGVLSRLQVDFVKIDRSVVNHAGTDQAARAVLAGIFALAREMGAFVIAEGIETVEMLDLINEMSRVSGPGAGSGRGVQGYLLGAPSLTLAGHEDEARRVPLLATARLGRRTLPDAPAGGHEAIAVGW